MKYKLVKQSSEEDCGAACVASIAKYYGHNFAINQIREAINTGQKGTTLLDLRQGTEALGFHTESGKVAPDAIPRLTDNFLPAIIHWQGYHWVVLYGKRGKKYIIGDPAVGIRYISYEDLVDSWEDGVLLLIKPDKQGFLTASNHTSGWNSGEKFWQYILNYQGVLLEGLLCTLVIGVLSLSYPFFLQILTDDVLVRGDREFLGGVVLAVATMYIFSRGLGLVENVLIAHFAQHFQLNLMLEFGQQILHLPLKYYESRQSGEIVSRLQDIEEINRLISQAIINLPVKLLIALVCLVLMLFYSWKLTIVAILIAGLMTLSTVIFIPKLQQKTRELMVLEAETQGVLVETFKGALTMKTITAAPYFWQELQSRFTKITKLALTTIHIEIINKQFSGLVSDIGGVGLLWIGSGLVFSQELTIGQLIAFVSLNRNIVILLDILIDFVDEFASTKTALSRLQEVLTFPPENQPQAASEYPTISHHTNIVCEQLSFHYPGREHLLQDFSLTIPGGKVTALVGRSGCGKSTLAKLIAGLYPLEHGNIYFGDEEYSQIPLDCLRQQIVLVPQEAHFWSRSIMENFSLGYDVSLEEIRETCQVTQADEFIERLPEKYQTVLGEFGANLSGGQKQKLAIARAIINDPPILILDESTAGLDPASEEEFLNQLLHHRLGKTTILISHRPRVNNRADWVVLLEDGQVKRTGTPEELRCLEDDHLYFLSP
ncbi:peptidase domain-containing ABC transporter [Calothrix rhizosoleniae]|uniref:peptidase domain-containing ABC transporter n=1 Tax=Calothrix rhizosoleniae TaxID=888997 RepID=UPI000B49D398|nr:peptidase domain-containing ABC transporter [Calothrix rhizosoleniae]